MPSTLISKVWLVEESQDLVNTILRASLVEEYRSTVLTFAPSIHASALPRPGPVVAIQATCAREGVVFGSLV